MKTNSTLIVSGSMGQADLSNKKSQEIIRQRIQPKPTITPEKIGRVMADIQSQIDGLQLYLIELGLAKIRVTLLSKKGWAHGRRDVGPVRTVLYENTSPELE